MAQAIMKKTIDPELESSEGFDNPFLEEDEEKSGASNGFADRSGGGASQFSLMPGPGEISQPSFSLDDDFDDFDHEAIQSSEVREPESEPLGSPETSSSDDYTIESGTRPKIAANKVLLVGTALLVLVIIAGIMVRQLFNRAEPDHSGEAAVKIVKHAIPTAYYKEEFEFLMLANAQQGKNLVSFGLEFSFSALNSYDDFRRDDTIFRDAVYRFLLGQHPVKNSVKYWQDIVENKLLDHLKATFPGSGVRAIRVTTLDRI